jgi:uncharacterized protein (TIGR03118 family)
MMKTIGTALGNAILAGGLMLLNACGGYGSGSSQPTSPATVTIQVARSTIVQGEAVLLTWSSNAPSCSAGGAWTGAQAASGSLSLAPITVGDNTFTLTCNGGIYASNSASAVLVVTAASAFTKSNLVSSDGSVPHTRQDPKLIDPWGIAVSPASAVWAANSGSNTGTLYDGTGVIQSLIVNVPAGIAGNANPTGIVFNTTDTDFVVSDQGRSAGALFIFAGANGSVSGWNPSVIGTQAVVAHDSPSAVFKGLALASNGSANLIYATDFHNKKVMVFDRTFTPTTVSGGFADTALPADYAPFGIRALQVQGETRIVVTYAKQDPAGSAAVVGGGLGIVNVFDVNGVLVKHLVAAGSGLNVPWGIALAPAGWGTLSGKMLVGNVGSGVINAYDPITGDVAGTVNDSAGAAIVTPTLRGIAFGNGLHNQDKATLYFLAGLEEGAGGLFGRIDLGASPPDIVAPTVQVTSPTAASTVSGVVPITVNAHDNVGVMQVEFFVHMASIGTSSTAPFTMNWDSAGVENGTVSLTAVAKDAAGNATSSAAAAVVVAN